MRWSDLQHRQPRLGVIATERLIGPGLLLVVTIRRDGTPRLSPVEPFVLDGGLWLSMMLGSRKAEDLLRDPRVLVHSIVTSRDGAGGEVKLRGTARAEHDTDLQARYATAVGSALGWKPDVGRFHLFEVDISDVTFIQYDEPTGDQYLTRWPPPVEFVRRGTGATTVGDPEPRHELLIEEAG